MSKAAEEIERARRAYLVAIGTADADAAYLNLRDVVQRVKQRARGAE